MPVPLTKESEVDVLIVGAGPAGLMGAHALKRAGVNVRVVDQRFDMHCCLLWRAHLSTNVSLGRIRSPQGKQTEYNHARSKFSRYVLADCLRVSMLI